MLSISWKIIVTSIVKVIQQELAQQTPHCRHSRIKCGSLNSLPNILTRIELVKAVKEYAR